MSTEDRRKALLTKTKTSTLLDSARVMEDLASPTQDERMTRAWIFDELESRAGKITLDEEPSFEAVYDSTGSYLAALVALRPSLWEGEA